jgi:hypothetical protein
MPVVNLQCQACGKVMAVVEELLGQQVRCPHCQQAVEALAPAVPSSPEAVAPLALPEPRTPVPADSLPSPQAVPATGTPEYRLEILAPPPETPARPAADADAGLPAEPFPPVAGRPLVQHGRAGGWFIALVVIPLISYSILATVLIVILYLRLQAPQRSPLEELPDLEGDFRGAARQKPVSQTYERIAPETPLPPHLRVGLGRSVQVGDVEVTPERIELRKIVYRGPNAQPEPAAKESLVLNLRLRNVSRDVVFSPTDPFFDRRWKPRSDPRSARPYTFLEVGDHRLYGGPLPWHRDGVRETVEGQTYTRLQPGEDLTTVVCTDPDDQVSDLLRAAPGPFLWRVQLRRGLVRVGRREIPATAVVGVEFARDEIRAGKPAPNG